MAQRSAGLWRRIDDLVAKTMLSVEGTMHAALASCSMQAATGRYNTHCFQLFGLDVMVDADATPWLLEVNLDPSLQTGDLVGTAEGANAALKAGLLVDTFNVVGIRAPPLPAGPTGFAATAESAGARCGGDRAAMMLGDRAAAERARRLTRAEANASAIGHVDAELARARAGGWQRVLPSASRAAQEHYATFVGEARRESNLQPVAVDERAICGSCAP